MKRLFLFLATLTLGFHAFAQDEIETTIKADFLNEYIWRGQKLGDVSVQPTLGVSYKGLSLTAWGSYGLSNPDDVKEFDITLGYTVGGLTFGFTDYWFSQGLDADARYFKYDAHGTNHLFEASIGYDFGHVALSWFTNLAGNDGTKNDGKRAYSSYFEVTAPFRLAGVDWTATAGAVPYATTSYGTSGFAVTNLSLHADKEIQVTDTFALPIFAQLTANPCSQQAYLIFGFTLQL